MEVVSTFDLRSKPRFSYAIDEMGIAPSELRTRDFPGSGSPSADAMKITIDGSGSPVDRNDLKGGGTYEDTVTAGKSSGEDAPFSALNGLSTAAVKLQKVYRSYRTRRRLADSAVVAEELWWQAIDFARLNYSTVSFFNFKKPETAASRWSRISLNASKVGKGLSKEAKAQKLAFQHWIEAIDPRHRYGHSLHLYYEEWCKADSGQPFFYWLDIGDGKELELKECPREKLRQQCIIYLGPQEREEYEFVVVEGKIIHKLTGAFLDTKSGPRGTKWIFVMSTFKKLYAGLKKKGKFHHSSFLAGGATLAAGRLEAENGILKTISAYSGHYRPTDDSLSTFLSFLEENGVNLNQVQVNKANEETDSYDDGKHNGIENTVNVSTKPESAELKISKEEEQNLSVESSKVNQTEAKTNYQRTLSGGLQSPRAEVPKTAILQRISSKKAAKSYQLGHQLSLKWTTGAGPRIGCVADYPVEVRVQALEFVNLSPRIPLTPSTYRRTAGVISPTAQHKLVMSPTPQHKLDNCNGDESSESSAV